MTTPERPGVFRTIEDLLLEGYASHAELASAIETVGVEGFDRFSRFVALTLHNPTQGGVSIDGALERVEADFQQHCNSILNNERAQSKTDHDPRAENEHWRLEAEMPLVSIYGWREETLPDFRVVHEKWCESASGLKPQHVPQRYPSKQAKVQDIFKGMIALLYGEDRVLELDQERSTVIPELLKDLSLKGYDFSPKTLSRWVNIKIPE